MLMQNIWTDGQTDNKAQWAIVYTTCILGNNIDLYPNLVITDSFEFVFVGDLLTPFVVRFGKLFCVFLF
jgi:hypothetical protein